MFNYLRVFCALLLLVCNLAFAELSTIDIELNAKKVIPIGVVSVEAEFEDERKRKLRESYLYNSHMGKLSSLYTYIIRLPSVLDAPVFDGVYNINIRGVNTSPLNHYLPFDVVIDGISFADAYSTPHHAYLLSGINFFAGVEAFNDISSGSQGVVSVNTASTIKEHRGTIDLDGNTYEQKIYGNLEGDIVSLAHYGFNFNYVNRPGRYLNKFQQATLDDSEDIFGDKDKLQRNNFDEQHTYYLNGYVLFPFSDELEVKLYAILNNQDRGFVQGYQTTIEDFENNLTPAEYDELINTPLMSTSAASSDVSGSFIKSNNIAAGADGIYYFTENTLEFGLNAQDYSIEKLLRIGDDANRSSDINSVYQEHEIVKTSRLEFVAKFKPIAVEYSVYRMGFNIRLENKDAQEAHTKIYSKTVEFGDSVIDLDHKYSSQTIYSQIYGDYGLTIGDFRFDVGGILVSYNTALKKDGSISENDTDDSSLTGVLPGLNNRLKDMGISTQYTAGKIESEVGFNSTSFLPKLSTSIQFYTEDLQVDFFLRYYNGYIPGGINPYAISKTGQENSEYQAQINRTIDAGTKIYYKDTTTSLSVFYIDMINVHYEDSLNGLEKYYGNAKSARSAGGEMLVDLLLTDKWGIDFMFTAMSATYTDFTHKAFSSDDKNINVIYTGNDIILSPKITLQMGSSFITDFGMYMRVESKHYGVHYFDHANKLKSPGYTIINAELGWEEEFWSIKLYGKNLANNIYSKGGLYSPYNSTGEALADDSANADANFEWENTAIKNIGEPLTFGLSVSIRY